MRLAGLEPARPKARDFKSLAATYYATVAIKRVERATRFELVLSAWKAVVLAVKHHTRKDHAARLFNLSAAYEAANAFGLTRGTTLHIPFI